MRAKGFTLIEVMLAMAIFAVGTLGLMQLQVIAARSGQSARHLTEATAVAEALAAKLQVLSYTDPLLQNSSTTNDMPLDGSGSTDLSALGATVDHCISGGGITIPAGWVSCTTPHSDGTIKGMLSTTTVVDQPGDPVQYYLAWDVQDADLRGDLTAGVYDAKIVVARVLWRDPTFGTMRSTSSLVVINNPAVNSQ